MNSSALDDLIKAEGIWAVYLFKRSGTLMMKNESQFRASHSVMNLMSDFLSHLLKDEASVTEVVLYYQELMLFFSVFEDGAMAVVADPRTVPSLIRVTLDVALNRG